MNVVVLTFIALILMVGIYHAWRVSIAFDYLKHKYPEVYKAKESELIFGRVDQTLALVSLVKKDPVLSKDKKLDDLLYQANSSWFVVAIILGLIIIVALIR